AGNIGDWTSPFSVLIDTTPPEVPILSAPINGAATNQMTVTFEWTPSVDTGGAGTKEYQLWVSTDNNFGVINLDATTVQLKLDATLSQATYYWQVRARDYAGNISDWSSPFSVLIDTTPPTVPELVSPINQATTNQMTITFEWTVSVDSGPYGSSGVKNYELQVSTDNNFVQLNYSTTTVQLKLDATIEQEGQCYWRVRTSDKVDNYSDWSGYYSLTIDTSAPRIVNNQSGDNEWQKSPGKSYNVDFFDELSKLDFVQYRISTSTVISDEGAVIKQWT
ncbi:MAG: hypothetical protein COS17_03590, partial [Elusimicrobia bacterium CG02_land_8_20_14_3_00_37_13]